MADTVVVGRIGADDPADEDPVERVLAAPGAHTGLDDVAVLVSELIDADVAFISVLGTDHTVVLGAAGTIADELAGDRGARRMPIDGSMCAVVREAGETVAIDDVRYDDRFPDEGIHELLGLRALAGAPVRATDGRTVGVVCGASVRPRRWRAQDVQALESLARFAERELARVVDTAERCEQADELALVVGRLRHELSGDLSVVLGGIDTALHPAVTDEVRRRALTNARTDALRVIDVMDALVRTDDRSRLQPQPTTTDELVADGLRAVAPRDEVRLRVRCAAREVQVAGRLVGRVIANLVGNALKHTTGTVELAVDVDDDTLAIEVVDEGTGFSPEAIRRLFEPYATGDDGDLAGFGLGLYIVRELVRRLGGSIAVDSRRNGSVVRVDVPVGRHG